jgi:hypothetical protein
MPLPSAGRGGEHVGDEETDGLRLLILVAARGAFVAVLGNRAEIVLAHVNRESPKSAALPFPRGSPRSGDVAWWSPPVARADLNEEESLH